MAKYNSYRQFNILNHAGKIKLYHTHDIHKCKRVNSHANEVWFKVQVTAASLTEVDNMATVGTNLHTCRANMQTNI